MIEEWRRVVEFPKYEVSNLGRVRGQDGQIKKLVHRIGCSMIVNFRSKHEGRNCTRLRRVHRVVLEAFIGPCPEGMEGCHNDGDYSNNVLSNIRWDTPVNNQADKVLHGTYLIGTMNPAAKVTETEVAEIRQLCADAAAPRRREIAAKYGVSLSVLNDIVLGRSWKHVPLTNLPAHDHGRFSRKLTPEQVASIRSSSASIASIARSNGIGTTTVQRVRNRESYAHLPA